jgi:hypothetical protein
MQISTTSKMLTVNKDAKRDKILEWMSPLNSFQRQADIFSKWQPGTGGWLLANPEFRDWESASRKTMWCRGMRECTV